MFSKILIANRGEIALRIMRTLREMGVGSVAVYSDADRGALHVRKADEAAHIGPSPSSGSYLNIERILDAARRHGVEAIHPGYGFLSENSRFAHACEEAGFTFIGPSAESIRLMGSKTEARRVAQNGGAPIVPGTEQGLTSSSEAAAFARDTGFPVMLKAVAGGGGKGMHYGGWIWRAGSSARRFRRGVERGAEGFWRRAGLCREADREGPSCGDSGHRGPAREHGAPGRARMFRATPPSKGNRGIALSAGEAKAGNAWSIWARRLFARPGRLVTTMPGRLNFWRITPATSIFWR